MFYSLEDAFFVILHSFLIIFNLFGWIVRQLRKYNLITLLMTAASWFILGIWYGWGYCPLTDWHWKILKKEGVSRLPDSYIKYLIDRLIGTDLDPVMVNVLTAVFFFMALTLSLIFNIRDRRMSINRN